MALHPIVVYHKESSKLAEKLFCCISDYLEHDTEFGFEMQRELVKILKKVSTVTEVDFFWRMCKNYKNMLNLCRHKDDFGIDATWVSFATSHGKSPCDGIGGKVKRLRHILAYKDLTQTKFWMYLQCWLFVRQTSLTYSFVILQRKEWKKFDLSWKKDLAWVRLYQEQEVTISSNQ